LCFNLHHVLIGGDWITDFDWQMNDGCLGNGFAELRHGDWYAGHG
jgi:hypothetical protein